MKMQNLWFAIENRLGANTSSVLWFPSADNDQDDLPPTEPFIAPFSMSMPMAILFSIYGWGILLILSSSDAMRVFLSAFDNGLDEYRPDENDLRDELSLLVVKMTPIEDCLRAAEHELHMAGIRAIERHELIRKDRPTLMSIGQSPQYKLEATRGMIAQDRIFMKDLEHVYTAVFCRNAYGLSKENSWVLRPAALVKSTFSETISDRILVSVDDLLCLDRVLGFLFIWFMRDLVE